MDEPTQGQGQAFPNPDWSLDRFLRKLASESPAPGGGSCAALVGALGVALTCKVVRILRARPKLKSKRRWLTERLTRLEGVLKRLVQLMKVDAEAYTRLVKAQKTGRAAAYALRTATRPPLEVIALTSQALSSMRDLTRLTGPVLGSDLKAAKALLKGAAQSARLTAAINIQKGSDPFLEKLFQRVVQKGSDP